MAPLSPVLPPPKMSAFRIAVHRSLALLLCLLGLQSPARAAEVPTGTWEHAISVYQAPKYPGGFSHFDYANPAAPKGGTLRLSNPDRRSSFDKYNPFTVKGVAPAAMRIFVFESLAFIAMDEPRAMYGLVAESMLIAPDLSAISFRIHPKARFSNGDPVTAEDVVHSFRLSSGKDAAPEWQIKFGGVAQVVAVDARTVRFDMKERTVDALFAVGEVPVFSRKWGAGKRLNDIVTEQPIATGPYTIDKAQMPRRLELKRNPGYWARDLPVRRGFYNFDRIIYRMYKDQDVRREAFKSGEFDIYKEYSAAQYVRAHQGPKWRDGRIVKQAFTIQTGSMMQSFQMNLRRPKFQDIRVREAIVRAFDFEKYNRYGTFVRADSSFNNTPFAAQGTPGAAELALLEPFRAQLPPQVFGPAWRGPRNDTGPNALRDNLRRAQELLAEAGWKVASDGLLRNAAGEAFEIEYLEPVRIGRFGDFQRNLLKLGITFKERLVDFALYRRRLESFDFDMVTIVDPKFTLPDAGTVARIYGSRAAAEEGSDNYRGVSSPAVDALIQRIGEARTLPELTTAARALDRVVMWNHWAVPVLFTRTEPSSYWNKFGQPKVQAAYMSVDTLIEIYAQPWPLMTWWDKSLAPSQAPIPAPQP
jgi:peptide/nickel transport system substrate-binding protein/microcin C transport system substrate-binding protein